MINHHRNILLQVSIPRLEPRNDPVTGKSYFVFMVQVRIITRQVPETSIDTVNLVIDLYN